MILGILDVSTETLPSRNIKQIIILCILGKVDRIISPDSSQWLPCLGVIFPFHENLDSVIATTVIEYLLEDPNAILIGLVGLAFQLVIDLLYDGIVGHDLLVVVTDLDDPFLEIIIKREELVELTICKQVQMSIAV